jgi:hypothetical protein
MNPEGLLVEKMQATKNLNLEFDENVHKQFNERLDLMVTTYISTKEYSELVPTLNEPIPVDKTLNQSSWLKEFIVILLRAFKNEMRNPMELKARFGTVVIFSAVCIIVFEGV